ncbi:MAG: hypothetical protein JRF71_08695 [Deltaproteobacteria bacterium]|nr:hypothetical protein [Deltaproteobacteria bacterium]
MKQKFVISRDSDKKELIIKEYAEIEKDRLSLVCEETYDDKVIKTAMEKSKEALYSVLRTDKLYPPISVTMNIGEAVIEIYGSKNKPSAEFVFNNLDFITKDGEKPEIEDDIEDKEDDLDELLEDNLDLKHIGKDETDPVDSLLKVVDDDIPDVEDKT